MNIKTILTFNTTPMGAAKAPERNAMMKLYAVESMALNHNSSTHLVTQPDAETALCGREWAGKPVAADADLRGWQKVCKSCRHKLQVLRERVAVEAPRGLQALNDSLRIRPRD
jgi:hypothetical protein